ncbi:MAG: tRNA 2-thiouridine(34) synthase MnmA [Sedimentisphaerales bacterium]|nr:tRNA 2-thiouridine(34) synthase MnmA [Sedimentisphaerales bacterium]
MTSPGYARTHQGARRRVAVAMSGGVDSSIAAALLKEQGHEVIGVTMCFSLPEPTTGRPACCGAASVADARHVAEVLGIRHHALGFEKDLERLVVADFLREYARGRTPNPCIRCNEHLKFGRVLDLMRTMDIEFLATGHYARIVEHRGALHLGKAADGRKDQSYFLYRLNAARLAHVLFPLGDYTKDQVRAMAKERRLPVAEKKESQEICFVPGDLRSFLGRRLTTRPGEVVDTEGRVLARHDGVQHFTIGQRKGLGIGTEHVRYVVAIDAASARVIVGPRRRAMAGACYLTDCVFPGGLPREMHLGARVRYRSPEVKARIRTEGDRILLEFEEPQFAVTPGQSAVLYDGDIVLGGGIIDGVVT